MSIKQEIIERQLPPPKVRRALREASGLSVIEVAELLSVVRQSVFRWERGDREPEGANRRAYAGFLAEVRRVVGS